MARRREHRQSTPVERAIEDHPTGVTNAALTVVALGAALGLDISAELALGIVGFGTWLASYLSPRFRSRR